MSEPDVHDMSEPDVQEKDSSDEDYEPSITINLR